MKLPLPRLFSRLLVGATIASIFSVIVFITYVLIGVFAGAHAQSQAMFLYTSGIVGLIVAEVRQILSIVTLVVQWVASKKLDKKPREIAVLILSLIPFMVIVVLLATVVVYLNERRKQVRPERRKELEEEAKEVGIDTLIDAGTNSLSSMASNGPSVTTATKPVLSLRQMQTLHAIHRVVGPTAATNVAGLPNGLLPLVSVALVATVLTTGSVALSRVPQVVTVPVGTIHEYTLPVGSAVKSITAGPDGNLWFTTFTNQIGRMTPSGVIHFFPLPAGSSPGSITTGPDGNLWITDTNTDILTSSAPIWRMTPSGVVQKFPVFIGNGLLDQIIRGPDGNLWFTASGHGIADGSVVWRITTSGKATPVTSLNGKFAGDITVGPDGNIWFTEFSGITGAGSIGRMTPNGTLTTFPLPATDTGGRLNNITKGPDGNLWFTQNAATVGRMTLNGTFQIFNHLSGSAIGITAGPDGNLWFAEGGSKIARITPQGKVTEFHIPSGSNPMEMTKGPDGNLWFTEQSTSKTAPDNIGRITP